MADFARGFGKIHTRTKSGIGFVGENYYADCQNLIRYPSQTFLRPLQNKNQKILVYPIYRRFFFDGMFSGRFELGFRMNPATIVWLENEAGYQGKQQLFDLQKISSQMLMMQVRLHLMDGRVAIGEVKNLAESLRDAVLLSTTKTTKLNEFSIVDVGSQYVGVGTPYVVIRATPDTPFPPPKQRRDISAEGTTHTFVTRSGVHQQNFDTFVVSSQREVGDESPYERMVRLVYTQIRTILFAHSFYLDRFSSSQLPKNSDFTSAVEAMLQRIQTLSPLEFDVNDAANCDALREMTRKLDVNLKRLQDEVTCTLQEGVVRKRFLGLLRYIDRKADLAVEASAATATQFIISGGR